MAFDVAVANGDGLVELNSTTTTGNSRAIDHAVTATATPSDQLGLNDDKERGKIPQNLINSSLCGY
jgi:hypothetical protein